jgi:short-subunit dehydrogenase
VASFHVAITGASGGLGRALAAYYAKEGALLSLCGRNEEELGKSSQLCGVFKPEVRTSLFDVRDKDALQNWISTEDAYQPIDLMFANAGVSFSTGPDGLEDPERTEMMFSVNTTAAVLTALYTARLMLPRRQGQIALISSQAGKIPLINTPGYSASKAGLRCYGLALRESLALKGVSLSVVCPGYIKSPMQEAFEGFMPFTWSAERAAAYIGEKLHRHPAMISFPWTLNVMSWMYKLLPGFMQRPLNRKFSFRVKN